MNSQPAKILIIEDQPDYRFLLKLNLEASGYLVELAEDGGSGLQLVHSAAPDLILLDLMLPVINGIDLCRQIRQFSTVPIMIVTARAGQQDMIAGLTAGADDYITKPFGIPELLARINARLRRSRTLAAGH
jgi:DNA-binding response OmpR family regulator